MRVGDGAAGVGMGVGRCVEAEIACVTATAVLTFCVFLCVLSVLCCEYVHVSSGFECWPVSRPYQIDEKGKRKKRKKFRTKKINANSVGN